ncbi:FecR family protein [Asticcacaulis sp. AC466]|uniref:FecR family protein n=1 Tax=Asticcacaulis sp. AC466 TaxID=1282362 RepID=UPI00138AEC2B|nr:FecR domain-containing protein [Asticcacaulis sp. AC466]
MTDPLDKDVDDLLEAAASWHARLDLGTAKLKDFERWRDADPRHAAAFARIVGTDESIEDVKFRLSDEVDEFEEPPVSMSRRHWLGGVVAGAGAVVLGGGGLFAILNQHAHAETAIGERKSLTLTDGAHLEVNTDTRLSWKWGVRKKEVWLKQGEIAVSVPASSQFVSIHALGYEIKPTEGEINVRIRDGALEITCLKGESQVVGPPVKRDPNVVIEEAAPLVLKQGQAYYSASQTDDLKTLKDTEIETVEAWQSDELLFTGQSLSAVVEEFNRYLTRKLVIRDRSIEGIRLGGRFNVHDAPLFLQSLRGSFGIHASDDGDVIALTRS